MQNLPATLSLPIGMITVLVAAVPMPGLRALAHLAFIHLVAILVIAALLDAILIPLHSLSLCLMLVLWAVAAP